MNDNGQKQNKSFSETAHFIQSKTNKVSTALYMVTDIIPEGEPWKNEVRSDALLLMRESMNLNNSYESIGHLETIFTRIHSLLVLAGTVRLISEMNVHILIDEIKNIVSHLHELKGSVSYPLVSDHTRIDLSQFFNEPTPISESLSSKQQIKQIKDIPQPQQIVTKKTSIQLQNSRPVRTAPDLALKINRTNTILQVIKDKREVTIKDLSDYIAGCSEKTIQRELLALVGKGVLQKRGEKRWSRYSFMS